MNLKAGWKTCIHHFVFPTPSTADKGVSKGKCKKCGKVNKAKNYIEFSGWNSSKPKPKRNTEKKNG